MIVLDSNVVSELMRPNPAPAVRTWVRAHRDSTIYTTAITLAEVGYGIERLPAGHRQDELSDAAAGIFKTFEGMVLPFDAGAAALYPSILVRRERAGLPTARPDVQIAAICRARQATLATRNIKDFEQTGVLLTDPWEHA